MVQEIRSKKQTGLHLKAIIIGKYLVLIMSKLRELHWDQFLLDLRKFQLLKQKKIVKDQPKIVSHKLESTRADTLKKLASPILM